jgi:pimeloyl-ACP methyl ester carboxylesterase
LQATPVVVVGGHLAANVAIEMALRDPARVSAVVLDGVYASTDAANAALLEAYAGLTPRLRPDGAHRHFAWDMTVGFLHEWNPRFRVGPQTLPQIYAAMGDYLQMGLAAMLGWLEADAPPPPYDVLARLAALEPPLLVLAAEEEALRPCYDRALAANARARGHEFPGNHPLFEPSRAAEYAAVIARFARGG